jgi:catechol 2,3-dioxygenase-like lactoylglutathione lyase family enzyme
MLKDQRMYASIAVSDLARARAWYEQKLGLSPTGGVPQAQLLQYDLPDGHFVLYVTQSAGTAQNTVAGWEVKDLHATVAELRARGVVFEEYDFGPDFRTVNGILSDPSGGAAAWFKDSEGNILGLSMSPSGA